MPGRSLLRVVLVASLWTLAVAMPSPAVAQVTDPAGRPVAPLATAAPATVLVFTAVDCPISDRYAPEVKRIAASYAARGVRVWIVYANRGERAEAARAHAESFGYGLPVAIDATATLADRAHAEVTPEAAVFDAQGRLAYHGRIDDRYVDFGVDRATPTTHELDDALTAVLAGRAVPTPAVPGVGCAIVRQTP